MVNEGLEGFSSPSVDSIFLKSLPIFCKVVCITVSYDCGQLKLSLFVPVFLATQRRPPNIKKITSDSLLIKKGNSGNTVLVRHYAGGTQTLGKSSKRSACKKSLGMAEPDISNFKSTNTLVLERDETCQTW